MFGCLVSDTYSTLQFSTVLRSSFVGALITLAFDGLLHSNSAEFINWCLFDCHLLAAVSLHKGSTVCFPSGVSRRVKKKTRSSGQFSLIDISALSSLQCIDTVGLVTGRAYSL